MEITIKPRISGTAPIMVIQHLLIKDFPTENKNQVKPDEVSSGVHETIESLSQDSGTGNKPGKDIGQNIIVY